MAELSPALAPAPSHFRFLGVGVMTSALTCKHTYLDAKLHYRLHHCCLYGLGHRVSNSLHFRFLFYTTKAGMVAVLTEML